MSINIDSGMIVGEEVSKLGLSKDIDIGDWAYKNNIKIMSPWFDSSPDDWSIGFEVNDVIVDEMADWMEDIKAKAKKFEELTGTKAKLIGMANVS